MFEWSDFSDVADDLSKNPEEAYLRSSIDRQYYSLFGSSREYLIKKRNKNYLKIGGRDIHQKVRDELLNSKDLNENERLKPTRRKYKDIDESCIFVGFPIKSISKYLPNIEDRMIYNDDMSILTIDVLDFVSNVNNFDDEYINWKNSVAIKTKNKSNNDNNNASNNLNKSSNEGRYFKIIELVQEIVSFPIEHKTMIENMLFISDIKQKFLKII